MIFLILLAPLLCQNFHFLQQLGQTQLVRFKRSCMFSTRLQINGWIKLLLSLPTSQTFQLQTVKLHSFRRRELTRLRILTQ